MIVENGAQERNKRNKDLLAADAALKAAEMKLSQERGEQIKLDNRGYIARTAGHYLVTQETLSTAPESGFELARRNFRYAFIPSVQV